MSLLYFAYGSNIHPVRLTERIGDVRAVAVARVRGYRLAFNKRDNDGSAKCNLTPTGHGSDEVLGAVYFVTLEQFKDLMQIEAGYRPSAVTIEIDAQTMPAATFVAETENVDNTLQPFDWYHKLVLSGVDHFEFPTDYRNRLRDVLTVPDEEHSRSAEVEQTLLRINQYRQSASA